MQTLVYPIRTYRNTDFGTPRQLPLHDEKCPVPSCTDLKCKEIPVPRTPQVQRDIGRTKTRVSSIPKPCIQDLGPEFRVFEIPALTQTVENHASMPILIWNDYWLSDRVFPGSIRVYYGHHTF